MRKFLFVFLILFFSKFSYSKNFWIGEWVALDQWQSEFSIKIHENGMAESNYGNGEKGEWSLIDGNLKIIWNSGKSDYFFHGVMGYQRIRKEREKSYTSGLMKSSN